MAPNLISIVDDDECVRRTTKLLIESFGYRARVFESAETFLRSCQLNDTSIPIIFVSAYGNNESHRQPMHAGAAAFVDKPFSDEQLLDSIRSALKIEM